jgi:hypothetical protein
MALPVYADDDGPGSVQALLPPPGMTVSRWVASRLKNSPRRDLATLAAAAQADAVNRLEGDVLSDVAEAVARLCETGELTGEQAMALLARHFQETRTARPA